MYPELYIEFLISSLATKLILLFYEITFFYYYYSNNYRGEGQGFDPGRSQFPLFKF